MSACSPVVKLLTMLCAIALAVACSSPTTPPPVAAMTPEPGPPPSQPAAVQPPGHKVISINLSHYQASVDGEPLKPSISFIFIMDSRSAPPPSQPGAVEPPVHKVLGIDISHYQPSVDWEALKSSISFVFIKATDATKVDPHFASHWTAAKKAGLPRGAYHFFHPKHDVAQQVANFTMHLRPDPGELPPVVDVEEFRAEYQAYTCEQLAKMIQLFSEGVEKELGRKPMIYTNHETWKTSFCDHEYFKGHQLWLAAYTKQHEAKVPTGWQRWHFWQFTDSGRVPGISGSVDQSYFHGSLEELKALAQGGSTRAGTASP